MAGREEICEIQGEEDVDMGNEIGIADFDTLMEYVHVDENGELVQEQVEDAFEEDDMEDVILEADWQVSEEVEQCYVQYTLNEVIVDITEFGSLVAAEPVNQKIARLHDRKKYYTVVYLFGTKILRTELIVGYDDKETIAEIVKEALKGGKVT